ncbi:MAG: acyl-CoA thioesterase [Candidatus Thiodiazotropha sp.]|jgi:acyl-CoA thioester hydrolase
MSSVSSLESYEMEVAVERSHIDRLGHVNNIVYLSWVQDVAVSHWFASATEDQKSKYLWVVAKHEIEYKRPSMEGDVLVVSTWVGESSHRLFTRHTRITRKTDGKEVVKALTHWAPVDMATKKPVTPSKDIYEMFSSDFELRHKD